MAYIYLQMGVLYDARMMHVIHTAVGDAHSKKKGNIVSHKVATGTSIDGI